MPKVPSFTVSFPYSSNSVQVGKRGFIWGELASYNSSPGSGFPVPPGYSVDWYGYLTFPDCNETMFTQNSLVASAKSKDFSPKTTYSLFYYNGSNLMDQVSLGNPVKGKLQFSSPFQDDFEMPASCEITLEIAHPV